MNATAGMRQTATMSYHVNNINNDDDDDDDNSNMPTDQPPSFFSRNPRDNFLLPHTMSLTLIFFIISTKLHSFSFICRDISQRQREICR